MAYKTKQLEKDILNTICEYLAAKKYFFYRQNTTPIFDSNKQVFRAMPKWSRRGVPDIIVVHDGMFIGVEVKKPGGKLSEYQKKFQEDLEEAGGHYILATCLEDISKQL